MTEPHTNPFPANYAAWRECITVRCRQPLTRVFVEMRLRVLGDPSDPQSREFRERYGEAYTQQVIGWFEQALREATA